jgi:phosphatidylglycerol:prolipoprotein diacylglycerol transferase
MNLLSINFPSWLKPEIIQGLPIRWYGLMYIFAFGTAFLMYRRQVKERKFPMSEDDLSGLFFWGILSLLLGARLFSAIVYNPDYYLTQPWLIFWPFQNGKFTGLQGMSYHGGAFGGLFAVIMWAKVKRYNFREIGDMFAAAIPLGYTFGRLGNFINQELYGRVTASPIGMIFPNARGVPTTESWAIEIAEKTGIDITGLAFVNLPRHPSQLYEMIFEGIVLWAIIWFFRSRKPFKGFLIGLYFLGYGFFRFIIEYFRAPDSHLGYRIEWGKTTLPTEIAYSHPLLSFSTGQILCFIMILFGVVWLVTASKLPGREVTYIYSKTEKKPVDKTKAAKERNKRRKLRKRLK